jgi:stage V sporulation protein SpoVS
VITHSTPRDATVPPRAVAMDTLATPTATAAPNEKPKNPATGHRRGGRPPPGPNSTGRSRSHRGDVSALLDGSLDELIAADKPVKNQARGHRRGGRVPAAGQGGKAQRGDNEGRGRGGGGGSSKTPYGTKHHRGRSVSEIAAAPNGERTLKVSATIDAKALAGSIVLVCDGGYAPLLLPMGAQCVNQAMKAIAIARGQFLENENGQTFLSCFPSFRDDNRNTVQMQCDKETKGPWRTSTADLVVGGGTEPTKVAGAIAGNIREGEKVAVRACGADAVANAVFAVAHARRFLADEGIDLFFTPEFEKEQTKERGEWTVVLFRVCKASGSAATGK